MPPALVDRGRVLLLQPRRVAARAMAHRIAEERGWTVGREVGWHIRFDRRFTRDTRLLVVTEGILTAYLQDDPLLSDVITLIIDEFHERSVHADLGLALAKQAWTARNDLRILVMSATLDTAPVSAFLDGCPVIAVPGTLHPLTIDYAPGRSIAGALDDAASRRDGQCAVFPARRRRDRRGDARGAARRPNVTVSTWCRCTDRSTGANRMRRWPMTWACPRLPRRSAKREGGSSWPRTSPKPR